MCVCVCDCDCGSIQHGAQTRALEDKGMAVRWGLNVSDTGPLWVGDAAFVTVHTVVVAHARRLIAQYANRNSRLVL